MRLLLITICWLLAGPMPGRPFMPAPPDLIVRLRDAQDVGIPGIAVVVRDGADSQELAHATTDREGTATFSGLRVRAIRLTVAGRSSAGTRLYLPGNDARGMAVSLSASPTELELRSEPDGMVLPDPATMIVAEASAGDRAADTALATTNARAPAAQAPAALPQFAVLLLGTLVIASGAAAFIVRHRRAS